MRKTSLLLVLLLITLVNAWADEKADVLKADQKYVEARVKGDSKALEVLLAADFLATNHAGKAFDKAQFLAYSTQRDLARMDPIAETVKVRVNGSSAVVTLHCTASGADSKEGKFDHKPWQIARTWIKTKDGWKLFSLHWYKI